MLNLVGEKYGRLTVHEFVGVSRTKRMWRCTCECDGKSIVVVAGNLRSGNTRSCGCDQKEAVRLANAKHGLKRKFRNEYWIWEKMRARCHQKTNPKYPDYGGRGIKVCERWNSFATFLEDINPRPSPDLSLDRINNDGNYEPSNCRWATDHEQRINQRPRRKLKLMEKVDA